MKFGKKTSKEGSAYKWLQVQDHWKVSVQAQIEDLGC